MTTQSHDPDDDLSYFETELPKVIAGVRRGERWEYRPCSIQEWLQPSNQTELNLRIFVTNGAYRVRLAPVQVVRPWSEPADVPGPVCWLRNNQGFMGMVIGLCDQGPIVVAPIADARNGRYLAPYRWENLCGWKHSTDLRHWSDCVKPEGGK